MTNANKQLTEMARLVKGNVATARLLCNKRQKLQQNQEAAASKQC
jgi:hypothetical protein